MHDRVGPDETGFKGILQTIADGLKLLQKEQIIPKGADKAMFVAAPVVIFVAVFAAFATIPLAPQLVGSGMAIGAFYFMAIVSLDVLGFLMAGWASANKFSLYGAMRAVAQIISYEVPISLMVLSVVMISQSLDLQEIIMQQGILSTQTQYLFGLKALGVAVKSYRRLFDVEHFPLSFIDSWVISLFHCFDWRRPTEHRLTFQKQNQKLLPVFKPNTLGFDGRY